MNAIQGDGNPPGLSPRHMARLRLAIVDSAIPSVGAIPLAATEIYPLLPRDSIGMINFPLPSTNNRFFSGSHGLLGKQGERGRA